MTDAADTTKPRTARAPLTVGAGMKIASRHPTHCARLLANNLYPLLDEADWFTKEWRLKFCAYFLENIIDESIEAEIDPVLMQRVRRISMTRAVKLIGSGEPEPGLKVLVALLCTELRDSQGLGIQEQYEFYNILFGKFFPDCGIQSASREESLQIGINRS